MEKFIPYEKLSKKEKRKIDKTRRQTWGELNPVTRKPENSKAYNRNKARAWKRDYHEPTSGLVFTSQKAESPSASLLHFLYSRCHRCSTPGAHLISCPYYLSVSCSWE